MNDKAHCSRELWRFQAGCRVGKGAQRPAYHDARWWARRCAPLPTLPVHRELLHFFEESRIIQENHDIMKALNFI